MALVEGHSSPVPGVPKTEDLGYYKTQYEQLEAELADFQASSKDLEAELEKDIEAAEKRERQLQEKLESLGYEAEEWKTKYRQAKTEANSAQNNLQKEITNLRESNRTMQLKLRDIEVSNDDMERQARNTTSSLEDLETKYNAAIEREVMAEEEIKSGEREREALRIESQRLRDELSDLKIEAEIRQDKLRNAESMLERRHERKISPLAANEQRPQSASSDRSPATSNSSPTIATPPTKSASSTISEAPTPPSPPTSEKSNVVTTTTPSIPIAKSRLSITDSNTTPRAAPLSSRGLRASRGPSIPVSSAGATPHISRRTAAQRTTGVPHSGSLHHLHGLMNKMSLLEQRVQSVRSKLPAPTSTSPRASPRSGSALGQTPIPATVTVRSNRKRTGGSNVSSQTPVDRPSSRVSSAYTAAASDRPSSRLSMGLSHRSPHRESSLARPPSRDALQQRPPSRSQQTSSRPSSRASLSSRQSLSHVTASSATGTSRPTSRQSITGTRTPLGHYAGTSLHTHSASVGRLSNFGMQSQRQEEADSGDALTPTPSRRSTFTKGEPGSSIPAPSGRLSGIGLGRRISSGTGDMRPPEKKASTRTLGEVGESY